jgi:hypothetical protein
MIRMESSKHTVAAAHGALGLPHLAAPPHSGTPIREGHQTLSENPWN